MTQQKHTPTPYFTDGKRIWKDCGAYKSAIADVHQSGTPEDAKSIQESNAAFIVRACNAHDELVEALEKLMHHIDNDFEGSGVNDEIYHVALAALAKARGE